MLPLTEKRLRANRANAAKSTGPVTPEGKAASAANSTRHGLLAKQILVGTESSAGFQQLCDILINRFAPVGPFEMNLIEELAASYWRLRRAWALETEMFESAMAKQSGRRQLARMDAAFAELSAQPKLPLLHRYESRLHLMYQRALKNLLLLRHLDPAPVSPTPLPAPAPGQPHADLPNEPITLIAINEFPAASPAKPHLNRPKSPPNRPEPTHSEPLP